jgi:glycosyltransferase involved in cell wall biosynthesis
VKSCKSATTAFSKKQTEMKIAVLTSDSREHYKDYANPTPAFGAAPEALLQGFAEIGGAEIHVVSCTRQPVNAPEKIAANIWYHNLHVPRIGWLRTGYQGCVRAVRKKLREIQPDIVHGQGTEHNNALCAVFSGFPNVVTIHGNMKALAEYSHARIGSFHWLTARLEALALRRTAGVFCNSTYTENQVALRARRTWRVANPLRSEFFKPPVAAPRHKNVVLNVGVVCDYKRQLELLDVARRLHEHGLAVEFWFAGACAADSPYGRAFLEKIKMAETAGYARYLGMKNIGELVALLDTVPALVHFPLQEAFGLVVAEGLARGLKFFGARVGGVPDIAEGVPGAELFAKDDWAGLASSVERWLTETQTPCAEAAQIMRQRYAPEVIARRHLEIYREVLGKS